MATTIDSKSFKDVLRVHPRGEPLDMQILHREGVPAQRASAWARSGWLDHLGRGVYAIGGDEPTRDGTLAYLARNVAGFHVGGKTALAWHGLEHDIAFDEVLSLWGDRARAIPSWVAERFPLRYQTARILDSVAHGSMGLKPLLPGDSRIPVSVPERAMLEMLSDLGKTQSLADARRLMEGLGGLRVKVLDQLLARTQRIKVVRAAAHLAADLDLPWASTARKHSDRLGGSRWIAVSKAGERLDFR